MIIDPARTGYRGPSATTHANPRSRSKRRTLARGGRTNAAGGLSTASNTGSAVSGSKAGPGRSSRCTRCPAAGECRSSFPDRRHHQCRSNGNRRRRLLPAPEPACKSTSAGGGDDALQARPAIFTRGQETGCFKVPFRIEETLSMAIHQGRGFACINYPIGMNLGAIPARRWCIRRPTASSWFLFLPSIWDRA